jgi:hypothetical protein
MNNLRVINTPSWFKSTPRNQFPQQFTSADRLALFAFVRVLSVFSKQRLHPAVSLSRLERLKSEQINKQQMPICGM